MTPNVQRLAEQLLHEDFDQLSPPEQVVINRIANGLHISRNVVEELQQRLTPGQRLADRVASFGGSWPFIILFLAVMAAWIIINTLILAEWNHTFDPYPYILLNLFLSMLAAIQAPVIMMSQNRHEENKIIDRIKGYGKGGSNPVDPTQKKYAFPYGTSSLQLVACSSNFHADGSGFLGNLYQRSCSALGASAGGAAL